ncbi:MAG: transglutaminase domain-containing protein [Opitutales bacterium]
MRLSIQHRTAYTYQADVADSFNEVRLQPFNAGNQQLVSFQLNVEPWAALNSYLDFYLNIVHFFDVTQPHNRLVIESRAEVETLEDPRGEPTGLFPRTDLAEASLAENFHDFLCESDLITLGPQLRWCLEQAIPTPTTDVWEAVSLILFWVYHNFQYNPQATHVHTRPEEVIDLRSGVCQDFAHVMIGMCRANHIPARYVSGYFFDSTRDPGDNSQASHAWVETYIPKFGWLALDPTHNRICDAQYVKIGIGRDYRDIRPVSGTYRGTDQRWMEVDVRVEQVTQLGPSG